MSKYTTEVRFICENLYSKVTNETTIDEILNGTWDKIFTTKTQFFDEDYKPILCKKILKHYYSREIGAETFGLWQLWMNTKLEEIMPYYNKLYETELLKYNPLEDTNITRSVITNGTIDKTGNEQNTENKTDTIDTHGGASIIGSGNTDSSSTVNATNDSTTSADKAHKDLYSDTPQGSIANIENQTYLTSARIITDVDTTITNAQNNTTTKTGSDYSDNTKNTYNENKKSAENRTWSSDKNDKQTSNENTTEQTIGKQSGHLFSEMITKYRESFINIDMLVIDEFAELFMNLW